MSRPAPRLDEIERWMQSVIMHPGGVAEGVESPQARAHLDVTLADLESVIRRSRALSSANRLEIYVNAYYARLLECLSEEFSVTAYALGDDLFGGVAFGFLQHYPSRSYTLGQLGANFPRYLDESRLHAHEIPPDAGPSWPDFVVELARFERALYEVYDGPGIEQLHPLDAAQLAALDPASWQELRLRVAPCLRLHEFTHPVHEYWAARKDGGQPPAPSPRTSRLAIHRREYVVEREELSRGEFDILTAIVGGAPLSAALAAAASPDLAGQLAGWFARWTRAGYFVGFDAP